MRSLPDTTAVQDVNYNTAASGGASVIVLAADSAGYNVIDWVCWSYKTTPTDGAITITDSTTNTVMWSIDVTSSGAGEFVFGDRGLRGVLGSEITITMADGTATKKLNVQSR